MTKEDIVISHLLIPRYKVISEYPSCDFELGQVLFLDKINSDQYDPPSNYYIDIYNVIFHQSQLEKYKNIFRKLEWWEERSREEMPCYLKKVDFIDSFGKKVPDVFYKVKIHFSSNSGDCRDNSIKNFAPADSKVSSISYADLFPATENEYIEYLNK